MVKRTLKKSLRYDFVKGGGNKYRWITNNIKVEGDNDQMSQRRELHERISAASKRDHKRDRLNDIGTVLYLAGVADEEVYVSPSTSYDQIMGNLTEVKEVAIGGIITIESSERQILKMGLISLIDPLRITTRVRDRKLKVDLIPRFAGFDLKKDSSCARYYVPK